MLGSESGARLNRYLKIFVLLAAWLPAVLARAQSYSAGYNEYVQGNFSGAERAFRAALARNPDVSESARIYKMLGISQYMQGKRADAEESFREAKKLKPGLLISHSEVLDETVIDFFDSVEVPSRPPDEGGLSGTTADGRSAETHLLVASNARDAIVLVDGHLAGKIGTPFGVSPGLHEVSVSAKGYEPASQPVNVRANTVNRVSMDLIPAKSHSAGTTPPPMPSSAISPASAEPKSKERVEYAKDGEQDDKKKKKGKAPAAKDEPRPPTQAAQPPLSLQRQQQPQTEAGKRVKRGKTSAHPVGAPDPLLYILPLGAGQYANGDTVLGVTFTLLQAGGIGWAVERWTHADELVGSINAEVELRRPYIEDESIPAADRELYYAETVERINAATLEIDQARQSSILGLSLFGALWTLSILEAFVNAPDKGPRVGLTPKGRHILPQHLSAQEIELGELHPYPKPIYQWGLYPHVDSKVNPYTGFLLEVRVTF